MRNAVLLLGLVAGAGAHPDPQRHRLKMRQLVSDHVDAIV
jgi:hypothetical protein